MSKLSLQNWFTLSLMVTQLAAPAIARAEGVFDKCGKLEDQVRAEIERESEKQFKAMKYQARNAALLQAIVKAGKQDKAVEEALRKMKGSPKLDNDTRLKYNDLLVSFMHEKKVGAPKALVTCPKDFSVNETVLHTGLWQPDTPPAGMTRQGFSDASDMPKACQKDSAFALPEEYTTVSSGLGSSRQLNAVETDPQLYAITSINRPVTVKFRGKDLVLLNLDVMTYIHLKNESIEEVSTHLFLHGKMAKIDGRDIELESFVDNEILPPECKDFHYSKVATDADDGGSTTGGIINDPNKDGTDSDQKKAKKDGKPTLQPVT